MLCVGIRILLLLCIKSLATQIVFGVMIPIRAGPTVSTLDKGCNYLIHVSCRIKRESVLSSDEIAVQNDEIRLFLGEDLTHQRGGILVCWDAKSAFIFTVMEI